MNEMKKWVRVEAVRELRKNHYDLYLDLYKKAQELREDLKVLFDSYANPEDKCMANFSVHDDLAAFSKAERVADHICVDDGVGHLTAYDDYLKTKGGKYALSKEYLVVMDLVSAEARGTKQ